MQMGSELLTNTFHNLLKPLKMAAVTKLRFPANPYHHHHRLGSKSLTSEGLKQSKSKEIGLNEKSSISDSLKKQ